MEYNFWSEQFSDFTQVKLPNGEILKDTCIWPNFVGDQLSLDVDEIWNACLERKHQSDRREIKRGNGKHPRWVRGSHPALNYRGHAIKRHKMWFQSNYEDGLRKYGYTGWQWKIANAKHRIESIKPLYDMTQAINRGIEDDCQHNEWIVTRYNDGNDNIGLHHDKHKDFHKDSMFVVVKFGCPRIFEFQLPTGEILYSEKLSAGTAIFVGEKSNQLVKHAVPSSKEECGISGSVVGRCIDTIVPWEKVDKEVEKRLKK